MDDLEGGAVDRVRRGIRTGAGSGQLIAGGGDRDVQVMPVEPRRDAAGGGDGLGAVERAAAGIGSEAEGDVVGDAGAGVAVLVLDLHDRQQVDAGDGAVRGWGRELQRVGGGMGDVEACAVDRVAAAERAAAGSAELIAGVGDSDVQALAGGPGGDAAGAGDGRGAVESCTGRVACIADGNVAVIVVDRVVKLVLDRDGEGDRRPRNGVGGFGAEDQMVRLADGDIECATDDGIRRRAGTTGRGTQRVAGSHRGDVQVVTSAPRRYAAGDRQGGRAVERRGAGVVLDSEIDVRSRAGAGVAVLVEDADGGKEVFAGAGGDRLHAEGDGVRHVVDDLEGGAVDGARAGIRSGAGGAQLVAGVGNRDVQVVSVKPGGDAGGGGDGLRAVERTAARVGGEAEGDVVGDARAGIAVLVLDAHHGEQIDPGGSAIAGLGGEFEAVGGIVIDVECGAGCEIGGSERAAAVCL